METFFTQGFTTEYTPQHHVYSLWTSFKAGCLQPLDADVSYNMTTQRYSKPWITKDLKRLSRRKRRAYNRYLRTHSVRGYASYKRLKNETHARCKERYTMNKSTTSPWMRTTCPNVYGVSSRADVWTRVEWHH